MNDWEKKTCMFQKVASLRQREVHIIRIRTSRGLGGATMISSITNGSPALLATAAIVLQRKAKQLLFVSNSNWEWRRGKKSIYDQKKGRNIFFMNYGVPLHLIRCPSPSLGVGSSFSMATLLERTRALIGSWRKLVLLYEEKKWDVVTLLLGLGNLCFFFLALN